MANAKSKNYRRHIGIAYCKACGDIIISKGGGIFVRCACNKSFIDQERFSAIWVRLGGEAELIEQICPQLCKDKSHKKNDRIKKDIEKLPSKKRISDYNKRKNVTKRDGRKRASSRKRTKKQ